MKIDRKKISGLSLLEALVSTAIIGIGFVAAVFDHAGPAGIGTHTHQGPFRKLPGEAAGLVVRDVVVFLASHAALAAKHATPARAHGEGVGTHGRELRENLGLQCLLGRVEGHQRHDAQHDHQDRERSTSLLRTDGVQGDFEVFGAFGRQQGHVQM